MKRYFFDRFQTAGILAIATPLMFIVLLVTARTVGRAAVEDLGPWDEAIYIEGGLKVLKGESPNTFFGPGYAFWYALLGSFNKDPLVLYRASWPLLLALNLLAWVAIATKLRIGRVFLTVGLIWLAVSHSLDHGWPYVGMFVSAGISWALVLAMSCSSLTTAFLVLVAFLGFLVYSRPEFTVALSVFFVAACIAAFLERRKALNFFAGLMAALVPLFIMVSLYGSPIVPARSVLAFGQHYALNVKEARGGDFNPWYEWKPVVHQSFGEVSSVGQAAVVNPKEFIWHVGRNAKMLVDTAMTVVSPRVSQPPALWQAIGSEKKMGRYVTYFLLVGVILAFLGYGFDRDIDQKQRQRMLVLIVCFVAMAAAQVAGSIVVRPRPTHMSNAILIFMSLPMLGWARRFNWNSLRISVAIGVAALLFLPSRAGYFPWYLAPGVSAPTEITPVMAAVKQIRALGLPADGPKVRIVERDFGRGLYAGLNAKSVAAGDSLGVCSEFSTCLKDFSPDIVVVEAGLREYYGNRFDETFVDFVNEPSRYGYYSIPAAPTKDLVVVKEKWRPSGIRVAHQSLAQGSEH